MWVGLDVGKTHHHATVLDDTGTVLVTRRVANTQGDLEDLIRQATTGGGEVFLVIDQPGSIAQITRTVAHHQGVLVAYIPGLVMRRAADLYPGEAKTDARDSYVLADTARTRPEHLTWIEPTDDLLTALQLACGRDEDLAHDYTRTAGLVRTMPCISCAPRSPRHRCLLGTSALRELQGSR